jgi:hypothetical protein
MKKSQLIPLTLAGLLLLGNCQQASNPSSSGTKGDDDTYVPPKETVTWKWTEANPVMVGGDGGDCGENCFQKAYTTWGSLYYDILTDCRTPSHENIIFAAFDKGFKDSFQARDDRKYHSAAFTNANSHGNYKTEVKSGVDGSKIYPCYSGADNSIALSVGRGKIEDLHPGL